MSAFLGPSKVKRSAKSSGFSEAELQAAAWARKHSGKKEQVTNREKRKVEIYQPEVLKKQKKEKKEKKKKHKKEKKEKKEKKRKRSVSVSTARSGSRSPSIPKERFNPLDSAYDRTAYDRGVHRQKRKRRSADDDYWQHDKFFERSASPRRDRTDGPMANTRKGQWKSRAGGVFLPPDPVEEKTDEEAEEPAKYIFPEDFQSRNKSRSRSPTPVSRGSPRYELDSD